MHDSVGPTVPNYRPPFARTIYARSGARLFADIGSLSKLHLGGDLRNSSVLRFGSRPLLRLLDTPRTPMTLPTPSSERVRRRFAIACACAFVLGCGTPYRQAPGSVGGGDSLGTPPSPLVADDEALQVVVLQAAANACADDASACSALASMYVATATETETFDLALMAADDGCSRGDSASCATAGAIRELPTNASLESRIWHVLLVACTARPTAECAGVTRWYLSQGAGATQRIRLACGAGHPLACLQSWGLDSRGYDAVEFACGEGLALACLTGPDGESVL